MSLKKLLSGAIVGVSAVMLVCGQAQPQTSAPFQPLDEASYNQVLQRRHFGLTRDQLITLGEQEYQRVEAEMNALAKQIDPSKSWREIIRDFEQNSHPKTVADVIPAYEAEINRAKAFMLEKNLVSFPFISELKVMQTPSNMANSYPYAGYLWADDVFLVTLGSDIGGDDAEVLRTHNDGLIAVAAVHEAYPGHRVQNLVKPEVPTTLIGLISQRYRWNRGTMQVLLWYVRRFFRGGKAPFRLMRGS